MKISPADLTKFIAALRDVQIQKYASIPSSALTPQTAGELGDMLQDLLTEDTRVTRAEADADDYCAAIAEARKERIDDKQVGGDHYKALALTPWDAIKAMESTGIAFVDYARGDILAYTMRLKGGKGADGTPEELRFAMLDHLRTDLRKVAHYATAAAQEIDKHVVKGDTTAR